MNGKFLTSDEEERTSLELSIMLVLADKIWGDDSRFLNGHEIADVVNGIIVDAFGFKLFTLDGNVLGQGILRFAAQLKKSYGFEMERARNVSYEEYNSMPAVNCRGQNIYSKKVKVVSNTERRNEKLLLQSFKDIVAEKKIEFHSKVGLTPPRYMLLPVLPRGKHSSDVHFPHRSDKYQLSVCLKMIEYWQNIGEDPRDFVQGAQRMISYAQHSPNIPRQRTYKKETCVPWNRSLLEVAVEGAKKADSRVEFTSDQKAAIQVAAQTMHIHTDICRDVNIAIL